MAKIIEYNTKSSVKDSFAFYKEYFKNEDIAARSRKRLGDLEKNRQNEPLDEDGKKKKEAMRLYFERIGEEIEARNAQNRPK